ncbi:MAG: dihydroorotate dehydrogenase electron transfer subunit [Candidatus Gastranaerophilales bacterium]|nr:dihydroorotate dehydrogenase electron transfer subunit [Candidatus Gastranaerophilales bacterium]
MIKIQDKKIYKGKIIVNQQVCPSSYYMEIDCNHIITAKAGQFVSVYCEGLTLRRPFSIFSNNDGKVGILYKLRGKGTQYLKSLKTGSEIDITGAFGNGFDIKNKKSLLIGAGIGIAPVHFLKTKLDSLGIENILAAGFINKEEVPANVFPDKLYTDDGSMGQKGSVLNYTEDLIEYYKPQIIYACGPLVVLKGISEICKQYETELQVSMEKVMACSIGVCRGCIIKLNNKGVLENAAVCKDGPVFDGSRVVWQ